MRLIFWSLVALYVLMASGYGLDWAMRCIREKRVTRVPYVTECNPWACWTCHVRGHRLSDCYQHADHHRGHVVSRLDVYLRAMSKGVKP